MGDVLKKLEDSREYTVAAGDTLNSIAGAQCSDYTGETIALLNWGTKVPREVARAMAETVGVALKDATDFNDVADALALKFSPDAALPGKIRIPEKFEKKDLAFKTQHKLKLNKASPANVVDVTSLDRWFIPEEEKCDVKWRLEGSAAHATSVQIDVYGSEYAKATGWADNFGTWGQPSALLDVPVFSKTGLTATERGTGSEEWTGESTASDGPLKPGGPDPKRFVNAAFSPYTTQLRYWKADGDKDARIVLKPFWPRWKTDGGKVDDSFKIGWTWRKTNGKLTRGLLTILDKDDKPVWRIGLPAAKLSDAAHDVTWDGSYADGIVNSMGAAVAIPDDMPYRVRIEANAGAHVVEGLSLAAMQAQVRLYVHPDTLDRDKDPYKAEDDPASLLLSLAPLNHKDKALTKDADGDMWVREQLALAGWHAGPMQDKPIGDDDHLQRAVADFQRSVPREKTGPEYERQKMATSGADYDVTKTALEKMDARYRRPWFGKNDATRDDYPDAYSDEVRALLRDKDKSLIVWVDDRHWQTEMFAASEPMKSIIAGHPSTPKPERGTLTSGEARAATYDPRDIERPWLPFQVQPVLLGKADTLTTKIDLAGIGDEKAARMRRAAGPLRVDWSFDEIDGDAITCTEVDESRYGDATRTKKALEWALKDMRLEHDRKDVKRAAKYHNAPVAAGGIRPDKGQSGAEYFKQAFGHGADTSKAPGVAKPDTAREVIATVLHDDLGPDHGEDDLFKGRVGTASTWFRPSIIAGDGYRLRAQLRFEKTVDYALPNAEHLDALYPTLPQIQSAQMRLWRKSSIRAYLGWTPYRKFAAGMPEVRAAYAMAYLHIVNECGVGDGAINLKPLDIFGTADSAVYRAAVKASGPSGGAWDVDANITVTDDYIWPWSEHKHLGVLAAKLDPADTKVAAKELTKDMLEKNVRAVFYGLVPTYAELIEKKYGLMRGHIVIEFTESESIHYAAYKCGTCNKVNVFLEKDETPSEDGNTACTHGGCGGTLKAAAHKVHYTCSNNHDTSFMEFSAAGGEHAGETCKRCPQTLSVKQVEMAAYECNTCHHTEEFESTATSDANYRACTQGGCGGHFTSTSAFMMEDYKCDKCQAIVPLRNAPGVSYGTHGGQPHSGCASGGQLITSLSWSGNFQTRKDWTGQTALKPKVESGAAKAISTYGSIGAASIGICGGVSYNFATTEYEIYTCDGCHQEVTQKVYLQSQMGTGPSAGDAHAGCASSGKLQRQVPAKTHGDAAELWTHEIGHNRYMQHAANAPGKADDQHDAATNAAANSLVDADGKNWDRTCIMSYASSYKDYSLPRDTQCMCYRCVLKHRGWKISATHVAPSVLP